MTSTELQTQLKQETKYSRLYLSIILKAQADGRVKLKKNQTGYIYFEEHHILPESLFQEYSNLKEHSWNGVLLTAREHFICHILIYKHYKSLNYIYGERKMGKALDMLSNLGKYNSKSYENYNITLSHSKETRKLMSEKAKNMSKKHKENISKSKKDIKFSENHKKALSEASKGKKLSEEHKKAISEGNKGRVVTEETRIKIKNSQPIKNYFKIYNSKNELLYTVKGSLKAFCDINLLPFSALKTSYQKGIKLYQTKNSRTRAINSGNEQYIGWYTLKVEVE